MSDREDSAGGGIQEMFRSASGHSSANEDPAGSKAVRVTEPKGKSPDDQFSGFDSTPC